MQANQRQPTWLVPALVGVAVVGGVLLFTGKTSAAVSSKKSCPVDLEKLNNWLIEKQMAGECAPELSTAPPNYKALVALKLAPAEYVPYTLVLGDGSFWYYPDPSSAPSKSENLRKQFATFAGGSLKGHPADMFLW